MRLSRGPRPPAIPRTARQRAIREDMVCSRWHPHAEGQRATSILKRVDGARTRHVAEALRLSDPTVRLWWLRWAHAAPQLAAAEEEADEETLRGLLQPGLRDVPQRGRPATLTSKQLCQIVAVACEVPAVSGRPVTHGTPREFADDVIPRGLVPTISPRRIGRFLQRRGGETAAVAVLAQS